MARNCKVAECLTKAPGVIEPLLVAMVMSCNMSNSKTVVNQVTKYKERFDLSQVVWVGDRRSSPDSRDPFTAASAPGAT